MAYTIVQNPGTYSPVNAPIWVTFNSSSTSASDFKYIALIKKYDLISGVTSSIGNAQGYQIPPRPTTGYGQFSPAKILRSGLTYNLTPFITTPAAASQSIVNWNVQYGFSYNPVVPSVTASATFTDIILNVGTTIGRNLSTNGGTLDIQIGDEITVQLDNNTIGGQYNGIATVTFVQNPLGFQYISINKPYVAPGAGSGRITQIKRLVVGTTSKVYAYNGTRQYDEINENFSNTHVFYNNPNRVFALTNYKDGMTYSTFPPTQSKFWANTKSVYLGNYETLSIIAEDWSAFRWCINTYNSNYQVIGTYSSMTFPSQLYRRYDIPIGPQNLLDAGWFANLTNVKYYTLRVDKISGDEPPFTFTPKYIKYYEIECNGSPYPNNIRLAFQNLHGGFDYWNFAYKSTNTMNVSRTTFRKQLDPQYTVGDRQDTVLSTKSQDSWNVSSYWISQYDSNFLKELCQSPEVYVVDEDNNIVLPVIINKNSYTVQTDIDNKLFCASFNYTMAYDRNVQQS